MANPETERPWHQMTADAAALAIESDLIRGLDSKEADKRHETYGHNTLTTRKTQGPLVRFLLQFNQPLVIILLAATLITLFLQEWVESAVIFGVILLNAIIGFIQESKALKAIDALSRAMVSETLVIRNGERRKIAARDLVPGDIVLIQSGDKVPADLRLFKTRELRIDESTLTGESVPVQKTEAVLDADTDLSDRRNMAYASTLVAHGTGQGMVIATGDHTEIGRINDLISSADIIATPLTVKIQQFSHVLLYAILGLAAVTFVVGFFRGQDWIDIFMASVALAVSAIPEGLPAAITIMLAIGVSRMAGRHAIIRKLPAVETLGSTTVICSDKTGTLTQNQMTVTDIFAGGAAYSVSGVGYAPDGKITPRDNAPAFPDNKALAELLMAGMLCNDSAIRKNGTAYDVEGDPTEGALIVSAMKAGMSEKELKSRLPQIDALPFESARQYMATLHDQGPGKPRLVYVKGSIESLCVDCSLMSTADGDVDTADPKKIHRRVDEMAEKGLRVLAFSRMEMPPETDRLTHEDLAQGLSFLGIQGMIDPPRPEAVDAVRVSQEAGILVKMITGDHAGTAAAIARQLGLCGDTCSVHTREVITGRDLADIDEDLLPELAEKTAVLARVSPEQKLRLVEALQKRDHVVAMTGDGVNDAPALRQANIGVAMGITGTDVSKEAADMVLIDDNFSTIKAAVEEGRGIFDNLTKFITWILPTNGGQALVITLAIFLGMELPVLPLQILWVNMTTALLLGLMLAFEPREPGIMQRAPRDPNQPILGKALIFRILLVSMLLLIGSFGLFNLQMHWDGNAALARTLAVNVFIFGQMFYLFNCRSLTRSVWELGLFSNPWVWIGAGLMTVCQLVFIYAPVFNTVFGTYPMGFFEWLLVLGFSAVFSMVIAVEKKIQRRF
ncbi:MAG TPA: cation-transporting P-type ATPase [Desulfotignum sp.]|nr:cation-transporting P-type ATPase [Desulfotignum sp.]